MSFMLCSLNCVYFSRFRLKNDGDGGNRRVSQIFDIIKDYKPKFLSVPQNDYADEPLGLPEIKFGNLKQDDLEFKNIITGGEYFCWSDKFRNNIVNFRSFAHRWAGLVNVNLPVDIAFVDEPLFFAPLIDKLNELNIPVIGIEHNIETLVRGQVEEKYQPELFKKESEYFKKCALVVTISHEDTVLLNNLGVTTLMLPYYPIDEQKELFLKIREARPARSDKDGYILLGTAHNIPTLEGMFEITQKWAASEDLKDKNLYVVGYGTEKIGELLGSGAGENIKIYGGVEEETLHMLLKQVKASIVFQNNGTGALTKIAELLIASVPVFANHHAARSYHNIEGITEYHDFSDLMNKLFAAEKKGAALNIPIPQPPQSDMPLKVIGNIIDEKLDKKAINDYRLTVKKQADIIDELKERLSARNVRMAEMENELNAMNYKALELERQLVAVPTGHTYRLGKFLLAPARIIRDLAKNIFK